jgi:hypothetical protein
MLLRYWGTYTKHLHVIMLEWLMQTTIHTPGKLIWETHEEMASLTHNQSQLKIGDHTMCNQRQVQATSFQVEAHSAYWFYTL